jgi:DNA-binding protein H-NS
MAKLTVTEIKKQIAALEAKAVRLAEEESKASVSKVRALMNQLGVTLQHLSSAGSKKASTVKKAIVGKKPATAARTSKGAAKYADPKTGKTWSGFGRAPGWIAGAKNRDAYLVDKSGVKSPEAAVKAPVEKKKAVAKKASTKKVAKPAAKKAVAAAKKVAPPAPAKKKLAAKKAAKKAASKVAAKKSAKKRATPVSAADASTAVDGAASSAT